MSSSDYRFDEFHPVGVDFTDVNQVATFDNRQGTDPDADAVLLERLELSHHHTLIDLGCGTGSLVCQAAQQCQQVYAVDVSRAMLDVAHRRCQQYQIKNVEFHHAGFLTYHHSGELADMVTTKAALHQLPDFWKGVALHRIETMLRPGGMLYIWDVVYSFDALNYQVELDTWIQTASRNDGQDFTKADYTMHVREEFSTYAWILEGLIMRAGFEILEKNYLTSTKAEYCCQKRSNPLL
ncbi:MAG: class I SAM-dependent methyltransferase [Elainellaceae cyanobacterium]